MKIIDTAPVTDLKIAKNPPIDEAISAKV